MDSLCHKKDNQPSAVVGAYLALFGIAAIIFEIAAGEFSSILTMAALLQAFGFVLLVMQIVTTGHAGGISASALTMDALALACRLSSTLWLNGYLPVDSSGDMVYQVIDLCSLALVLWLLWSVLVAKRSTYQAEADTFPVISTAVCATVLAALLHADMNNRPIFDTTWMAGLFISTVAVLPQLWLSCRTGGRMEALTGHYVAIMALSRAVSGSFIWYAQGDIVCKPWVEGINHGVWAILGAHALHLLLLGDFTYYYVRSLSRGGITSSVDFGADAWV